MVSKITKEQMDNSVFSLIVWKGENGEIRCTSESRIIGGDIALAVAAYLAQNTHSVMDLMMSNLGVKGKGSSKTFDTIEEMDEYSGKGNKQDFGK